MFNQNSNSIPNVLNDDKQTEYKKDIDRLIEQLSAKHPQEQMEFMMYLNEKFHNLKSIQIDKISTQIKELEVAREYELQCKNRIEQLK